jgi:hypothetical protein
VVVYCGHIRGLFPRLSISVNLDKNVLGYNLAIFSQTHPVTLAMSTVIACHAMQANSLNRAKPTFQFSKTK